MTTIAITEMGPCEFGVEVEEGDHRTGHRVTVPDELVKDIGLLDVDRALLVRESIGFLLDREPSTSISHELSLEEIPTRYPDYYDELRMRISAT
jgi:hypothetical protein